MNDAISKHFSRIVWVFLFIAFLALILATKSHAALQDCTLTWNPNSEADLQGYHIYAQTKGPGQYVKGQYQGTVDKGRTVAKCSSDLGLSIPGLYYFVLTAFDKSNNESDFSNEVNKPLADVPTIPNPGAITGFSVTPGTVPGTLKVECVVPDDGTGKPAQIDVRYQEGNVLGWGGASAFPCQSFPCIILGLKNGVAYTVQAIPVRRAPGSPSVFGAFVLPQTAQTLTDTTTPPIEPPKNIQISMEEKDGNIILTLKKGDLFK